MSTEEEKPVAEVEAVEAKEEAQEVQGTQEEEQPKPTEEQAEPTEEKPEPTEEPAEEKPEPKPEPAEEEPEPAEEESKPEPAEEESKPEEEAKGQEEAAEEEPSKDWGKWGALPEGFAETANDAVEKQALPLLDELKTVSEEEEKQTITGPDGYEYPPLPLAGIDILKRLWGNELPPNRAQAVVAWETKVRMAVNVGLAIPVPPRVPATEVLNRPAAAKKSSTDKNIDKWVVEEEPVEESDEMKEFREKGLVPETVSAMLEKREQARQNRNYQEADSIKADLFEMGVEFNDQLRKWRCGDKEGTYAGQGVGMMYNNDEGGNQQESAPQRPPVELQDIDLPGSWEDFLQLPDPKVLAVGPRQGPQGMRAWGAGGKNWGTHDLQAATDQAMGNCANQGVHRPRIIWPPQLASGPRDNAVYQGGKGGFRQNNNGYGKGGKGYGGKGYGGKGNYNY